MLPAVANYIRADADGVLVVNSRDVSTTYDKRHSDVLRDIEALPLNANLRSAWFRSVSYVDSTGRTQPSYDLTRDGFMLLVMGYNGERFMALKIAWIEAFNKMECDLRSRDVSAHDLIISAVRELVGPLSVRFDGQDTAIDRLETRVVTMDERLGRIEFRICSGRKRISEVVKREHVDAIKLLGGRCPCCGLASVIDENGNKSAFAEFDHFYINSNPSVDATWLICKPDHKKLTTGVLARDQIDTQFRSYQEKRRRLPGRTPKLF